MSQSFQKGSVQPWNLFLTHNVQPQLKPGSRTLSSTGRDSYGAACDPGEPKGRCLCGQPLRGENLPTSSAHGHGFMRSSPVQASDA